MDKYITDEQHNQIVKAMGKDLADIYIKWANENVEHHIKTWMENTRRKKALYRTDEELVKYLTGKFMEWFTSNKQTEE